MNSNPLFILDTFRITQNENPLLKFHIQRTFEALQFYHSTLIQDDILKLYRPFQLATSKGDQKCRLVIDPHTISVIKSEITAIDLLNDMIRLEYATHRQQTPGRAGEEGG